MGWENKQLEKCVDLTQFGQVDAALFATDCFMCTVVQNHHPENTEIQCSYVLISMGLPLAQDTFFLRGTKKNTLLVSRVVNKNINDIKISGPWR